MTSCDELAILRTAVEAMPHGLLMLDASLCVKVFNQRFSTLYGLPSDTIEIGMAFGDVIATLDLAESHPGMTAEDAWADTLERLTGNQPWCQQHRLADGAIIDVSYSPVPSGGWITTHLDVTERAKADEKIAYLALNDELTGAANRSVFVQTLDELIASTQPFVIMSLDLDRFKQVNDTFGHAAGDELLKLVVMRLKRTIRSKDLLARMGGDEFAFLFPGLDNRERVDQIAQQMVQVIGQPFKLSAAMVEIGASVGIEFSNGAEAVDGEGLMRRADMALYRAKFQGRGTYCYAESPSAMIANFREQLLNIAD